MTQEITKVSIETVAQPGLIGAAAAAIGAVCAWIGKIAHNRVTRIEERCEALEKSMLCRTRFESYVQRHDDMHADMFDKVNAIANTVAKIEGICEARHEVVLNQPPAKKR